MGKNAKGIGYIRLSENRCSFALIVVLTFLAFTKTAYAKCDCSNVSLLGDQVQMQFFAPSPVANISWSEKKTVDMAVEARPFLGVELDVSIASITMNFISGPGVSFPKNAAFKFSSLNPKTTNECQAVLSDAVITTSNQSTWVNTNSVLTEDSIAIPVSPENSAFTWEVGSHIFIKFEFDCRPKPCSEEVSWWNGHNQVVKKAQYDSSTDSCLVFKVPRQSQSQPRSQPRSEGLPFVWGNNYYMKTGTPGSCAYGKWDGANCWLGTAPTGKTAILKSGVFYYSK